MHQRETIRQTAIRNVFNFFRESAQPPHRKEPTVQRAPQRRRAAAPAPVSPEVTPANLAFAPRIMPRLDRARRRPMILTKADRADVCRPLVLVVEDEAHEMTYLKRVLANLCDVATAASSEEAKTQISAHRPNLIILDVALGAEDGTEILHEFSSRKDCAGIPIVMRSNHYEDESVVRGLAGGAIDYLSKALTSSELRQRVSDLLHYRRPRQYGSALAGAKH